MGKKHHVSMTQAQASRLHAAIDQMITLHRMLEAAEKSLSVTFDEVEQSLPELQSLVTSVSEDLFGPIKKNCDQDYSDDEDDEDEWSPYDFYSIRRQLQHCESTLFGNCERQKKDTSRRRSKISDLIDLIAEYPRYFGTRWTKGEGHEHAAW